MLRVLPINRPVGPPQRQGSQRDSGVASFFVVTCRLAVSRRVLWALPINRTHRGVAAVAVFCAAVAVFAAAWLLRRGCCDVAKFFCD